VAQVLQAGGARPHPNERARASVLTGVVAVLLIPAALALAAYSSSVDLTEAGFAVPVAALLGYLAISLSRGARRHSQITLGRVGGTKLARAGAVLGFLSLYLAVMAALSVAFFGLLLLFD
jgi:hypothetical protein